MRADIATRRARAPLPPIQVNNASAPAPEIHTSFDDALLQVKTPNTLSSASSSSRPRPTPAASPAVLISSQPTRPLPTPDSQPELRPDSRRSNTGLRRRDLIHFNSTPTLTLAAPITAAPREQPTPPTQRPAQRARPPPPDAPRTERLAAHQLQPQPQQQQQQQQQQSKPRKTRSSLFNLFTRPNVERARGAGRVDRESVPDTTPAVLDIPPSPRHRLSRLPSRGPSRRPSVERILDRNQSTLSFKSQTSHAHSVADTLTPVNPSLEVPKFPTSSQDMQRSKSSAARATWAPPPLFQAYPQSVKHSNPAIPDSSHDGAAVKKHSPPASSAHERPKSRPGTGRFGRPKSRKNDSTDVDSTEGLSFEAFSNGNATTKVYVLVTAGYLLQYAGDGAFDRLPEKILQLTAKSAAFASDLIPGKHWVLQVVQSSANDPFKSAGTQRSFFHKFSMSGLKRKDVSGMLMTFDSPDDMDSWMVAIRKEIERINSTEHPHRQTADQPLSDRSPIEQPGESVLSHRFVALSRRPSTNLGPPSPLSPTSPTVIDSERTSGTTQVGTLSDITGEWSPRDATIPYKTSLFPSGHRSRENILEIPEPSLATSDVVDVPVSPGSSIEDADFEYLFPPTPGANRQSTFDPSATANSQPTTIYTNTAHYSLSRQNSLKTAVSTSGEATASGQRISTYNLLPASSQRLSRQQSMPVLARQSSYPPPAQSAHAQSHSPNPMQSISESTSFFTARNSTALPSPPLVSPTGSSFSSRSPPGHWTNSPPTRQPDRASVRAYMSAENLQHDAQLARQNIESPDAVARRISARMSTLHHATSLESLGNGSQRASATVRPTYARNTSSYNAFALGPLPEGVGSADARRQSHMPSSRQSEATMQRQSRPGHDQHQQQAEQSGSNNSSSNPSRRTSFRNSGMPIPLQTSSSATSSPNTSSYNSRTFNQNATNATTLSSRQRAILALQGVSESGATTLSFKKPPTENPQQQQQQTPSPSSPSTAQQPNRPTNSVRPMSIHVSSDRAPFLSTNRPRAPASPTEPAPNTAPQPQTASKRDSTLVPIVRPPSLANHRLKASGARQMRMSGLGGAMGLPPQQPPPSMPLPMLPQGGAQRVN